MARRGRDAVGLRTRRGVREGLGGLLDGVRGVLGRSRPPYSDGPLPVGDGSGLGAVVVGSGFGLAVVGAGVGSVSPAAAEQAAEQVAQAQRVERVRRTSPGVGGGARRSGLRARRGRGRLGQELGSPGPPLLGRGRAGGRVRLCPWRSRSGWSSASAWPCRSTSPSTCPWCPGRWPSASALSDWVTQGPGLNGFLGMSSACARCGVRPMPMSTAVGMAASATALPAGTCSLVSSDLRGAAWRGPEVAVARGPSLVGRLSLVTQHGASRSPRWTRRRGARPRAPARAAERVPAGRTAARGPVAAGSSSPSEPGAPSGSSALLSRVVRGRGAGRPRDGECAADQREQETDQEAAEVGDHQRHQREQDRGDTGEDPYRALEPHGQTEDEQQDADDQRAGARGRGHPDGQLAEREVRVREVRDRHARQRGSAGPPRTGAATASGGRPAADVADAGTQSCRLGAHGKQLPGTGIA